MVLFLFSMLIAAIAVAMSVVHFSFGSLAGSGVAREDIAVAREQSRTTSPTKQFLVVVIPDGRVVDPMAVDQFYPHDAAFGDQASATLTSRPPSSS